MTEGRLVRIAWGALLAALLWASSPTSVRADNLPTKIHYDSAANLYLMRNLEHILMTWKPPSADLAELGPWIIVTRNRLRSMKSAAEAYQGDRDIVAA